MLGLRLRRRVLACSESAAAVALLALPVHLFGGLSEKTVFGLTDSYHFRRFWPQGVKTVMIFWILKRMVRQRNKNLPSLKFLAAWLVAPGTPVSRGLQGQIVAHFRRARLLPALLDLAPRLPSGPGVEAPVGDAGGRRG